MVRYCHYVLGSVPLLAQHYVRTDLTANSASVSEKAANIDGYLVNAWMRSLGTPMTLFTT